MLPLTPRRSIAPAAWGILAPHEGNVRLTPHEEIAFNTPHGGNVRRMTLA